MADEGEDCAVCLDSLRAPLKTLPCHHTFHARCITRWTKTQPSCPVCRQGLPHHGPPARCHVLNAIVMSFVLLSSASFCLAAVKTVHGLVGEEGLSILDGRNVILLRMLAGIAGSIAFVATPRRSKADVSLLLACTLALAIVELVGGGVLSMLVMGFHFPEGFCAPSPERGIPLLCSRPMCIFALLCPGAAATVAACACIYTHTRPRDALDAA
jgi:hypothetical protein